MIIRKVLKGNIFFINKFNEKEVKSLIVYKCMLYLRKKKLLLNK